MRSVVGVVKRRYEQSAFGNIRSPNIRHIPGPLPATSQPGARTWMWMVFVALRNVDFPSDVSTSTSMPCPDYPNMRSYNDCSCTSIGPKSPLEADFYFAEILSRALPYKKSLSMTPRVKVYGNRCQYCVESQYSLQNLTLTTTMARPFRWMS